MRRFVILILLLLTCNFTMSQGFINNSQRQVKKKLQNYLSDNNLKGTINYNKTAVHFQITDTSVKSLDMIFFFDDKRKCYQVITVGCDSCIMKYVASALAGKKPGWTKVNDSTYKSKYNECMLMKVSLDGEFSSYRIERMKWTKEEYDRLRPTL